MARALNRFSLMRISILVATLVLLAACRGEPTPRDYQNAPPDMAHPPATKTDTPSAHGMGEATPQPTSGVEGTTQTTPPSTTLSDTPPVTTTT